MKKELPKKTIRKVNAPKRFQKQIFQNGRLKGKDERK